MLLAMMFVAFSITACSEDDPYVDDKHNNDDPQQSLYVREMMVSNLTIYNWHDAYIQFMDEKDNYKKKMSIGTVEKYDHTYVQREEDYFFIEFKDDNGKQHTTEKYLTATTVSVRTVAK